MNNKFEPLIETIGYYLKKLDWLLYVSYMLIPLLGPLVCTTLLEDKSENYRLGFFTILSFAQIIIYGIAILILTNR